MRISGIAVLFALAPIAFATPVCVSGTAASYAGVVCDLGGVQYSNFVFAVTGTGTANTDANTFMITPVSGINGPGFTFTSAAGNFGAAGVTSELTYELSYTATGSMLTGVTSSATGLTAANHSIAAYDKSVTDAAGNSLGSAEIADFQGFIVLPGPFVLTWPGRSAVNVTDDILIKQFGTKAWIDSVSNTPFVAAAAAVPEPGATGLISVGLLAMLGIGRRSRRTPVKGDVAG